MTPRHPNDFIAMGQVLADARAAFGTPPGPPPPPRPERIFNPDPLDAPVARLYGRMQDRAAPRLTGYARAMILLAALLAAALAGHLIGRAIEKAAHDAVQAQAMGAW